MTLESPLVSVLIPTFNRAHLLPRAVDGILMQDFDDLELVIIDDCSSDNTREVVAGYGDPRVRYTRNDANVGSKHGDRAHLRRFVNELMRGKYFTVMSDDDYWLSPTRLRRQVEEFEENRDLAMVIGGQISHYVNPNVSVKDGPGGEAMRFTLDNMHRYFDLDTLTSKTPHLHFHQGRHPDKSFYSKRHLTSGEFLREFCEDAATKNINVGATLYSREKFIRSGAFTSARASKWQSGYELLISPACYGDVAYFNEPAILVEVRPGTASYRRTQVDHYLDSVCSIEVAFATALADPDYPYHGRQFLKEMRALAIRSTGWNYMHHTMAHRRGVVPDSDMCEAEHLSRLVTCREVLWALAKNDSVGTLGDTDLGAMLAAGLSPNPSDPGVTDDGEAMPTAGALLDAWLDREPRHPEALHLRALIAREETGSASAVDLFRRAVAARPDYASARINLGMALLEAGHTDDAIHTFREAVRLQKNLPAAHFGLGAAFQRLGQWAPAAAAYHRALTLAPMQVEAWIGLGNVLHALGQMDGAIFAHRQAIALRPGDGMAHANLGRALRAAGRIQEAVEAYREALARAPDLALERSELEAIGGSPAHAVAAG